MDYIPLNIPLTEIIKKRTFNGTFKKEHLEKKEITATDFQSAINDIKERIKVKVKSGKCSNVLINQIARHKLNFVEKFGNEIHHYHFQTILDTIEGLDNGLNMNVRPFKTPKSPLHNLMHIHHNSSTFISHNIINTWKKKYGKNDEIVFQNKLLKEIYTNLTNDFPEEIAQKKSLTILLAKLLDESKFKTIKKQTGEWIIFAKKDDVIYYLCLATHNEAKYFTDKTIYDRLYPCISEFPELRTILNVKE